MASLREKHQLHQFTVTAELDPRKSASSAVTENQVREIADYVDAVNIADCPMAKLRMSPIALSSIIQHKYGVESIFHLTCRDRNIIGLQAELLGAYALGVRNILTLTGDPPSMIIPLQKAYTKSITPASLKLRRHSTKDRTGKATRWEKPPISISAPQPIRAPIIWTRKFSGWKERKKPAPPLSRPSRFMIWKMPGASWMRQRTWTFPSCSASFP